MRKSIFFVVKYIRTINKETRKNEILEMVFLVDKIKNRDMDEAAIILDLINAKVEKSRNPDFSDYDTVLEHYRKKYPDKINPILEEYADIKQRLEELEKEIEKETSKEQESETVQEQSE